jgi:hypothetical protein
VAGFLGDVLNYTQTHPGRTQHQSTNTQRETLPKGAIVTPKLVAVPG